MQALEMPERLPPRYDAFLCHSDHDSPMVDVFAARLERQGATVWLDSQQIDLGDSITEKIQDGLADSRYMVICLSPRFKDSKWCRAEYAPYLTKEIKEGSTRVLPIRIDDLADDQIPDLLCDKYAVDVRTEEGFARLVRKVKARPSRSTQPVPEQPPPSSLLSATTSALPSDLETWVQFDFPHPIARAYFLFRHADDPVQRVTALTQCIDNTINLLLSLALADYHAHLTLGDLGALLDGLHGKSRNARVQSLFRIITALNTERDRVSTPYLLDWSVDSGSRPSRAFMKLAELGIALYGSNVAGSSDHCEELLAQVLASLTWLRSARLVELTDMRRTTETIVEGSYKVLRGVLKDPPSEAFCWLVSTDASLDGGYYLLDPSAASLLRLDPFLVRNVESAGGDRSDSECWMFCGATPTGFMMTDPLGRQAEVVYTPTLLAGTSDRFVPIRAIDRRLAARLLESDVGAADQNAGSEYDDLDEIFAFGNAGSAADIVGHLQKALIKISTMRSLDAVIVALDTIGAELLGALDTVPEPEVLQEVALEWLRHIENALETADEDLHRLLAKRRRDVENRLEDIAGGFSRSQALIMESARSTEDSPFAATGLDPSDLDYGFGLLASKDELDQSDGVDWLLRRDLDATEDILTAAEKVGKRNAIFALLWGRLVLVFLYHKPVFSPLIKYMLAADPDYWRQRVGRLWKVFDQDLEPEAAQQLMQECPPAEVKVYAGFLALHPRHGCRNLGRERLAPVDRWELLVAPATPLMYVQELIEASCEDCPPSCIKAMFLMIRPRLRKVGTPFSLYHAFEALKAFYQVPVFLESAFFSALTGLHKDLDTTARSNAEMETLSQRFEEHLNVFRRRIATRDSSVSDMRSVPLPIQRKLARDGHFIDYFICSSRDVIALETVRHALRRSDVIKFFKNFQINRSVLRQLAEDRSLMREPSVRLAFCKNPKADSRQLNRIERQLSVEALRLLAVDHDACTFARSLAQHLLRSKKDLV